MTPVEGLLSHLFALRFPLLFLLFLLLFPLIALKFARSLLANLLDLRGVQLVWVTVSSCVLGWTVLVTGWMVLSYGSVRINVSDPYLQPPHAVPGWPVVWGIAGTTFPIVISSIVYSRRQKGAPLRNLLTGGAAGYAISIVLVVATRAALEGPLHLAEQFSAQRPQHSTGWLRGYLDQNNHLLGGQGLAIGGFVAAFVVYLAIGALRFSRWSVFRTVPSLSYVLLLATLACWTLTGMSFFLDAYRIPVSLVIIIYSVIIGRLAESDHFYYVYSKKASFALPTPGEVLAAAPSDSVILVAANGGGIQSAAWTAKVLSEIDRSWRRIAPPGNDALFAKSLRAISSVSGGSVGAMFFTAAYGPEGLPDNPESLAHVEASAKTSSLDDIAWGLVYPDLWSAIAPFLIRRVSDRGKALEDAFKHTQPAVACGLTQWRAGVRSGQRPASLFNGTLTETGGRWLIATSGFSIPPAACSQFYDRYPDHDLSIATAARLSATFPFVTPAARADLGADGKPEYHVVDGGYYDNYGMSTLVEWLKDALTSGTTSVRRVLVLQLRGFPPEPPDNPDRSRSWFYQLYAPFATMLHARSCGQLAHNDIEFDLLSQVCKAHKIEVQTAVFQFQNTAALGDPPLSWHLTNRQKQAIDEAWLQIGPEQFQIVRSFLETTGGSLAKSAVSAPA